MFSYLDFGNPQFSSTAQFVFRNSRFGYPNCHFFSVGGLGAEVPGMSLGPKLRPSLASFGGFWGQDEALPAEDPMADFL